MRVSVRSLFYVLVIPLAMALIGLLLAELIPFISVREDIVRIERDLTHARAIRDFASAFTEQTREYADLIIIDEKAEETDEIRRAAAKALARLSEWRKLVQSDRPDELETLQSIETAYANVTSLGEIVIALVEARRHDEAAVILTTRIYPVVVSASNAVDQCLINDQDQIARRVTRIIGGIDYGHSLKVGRLEDGIEDLDSHVNEVLQSAALNRIIEREVRNYWYFVLTRRPGVPPRGRDHQVIGEIAVGRHRAGRALAAWRIAVRDYRGSKSFGGPRKEEELRFIDRVEREYRALGQQGEHVIRLVEKGSHREARELLARSLEFDEIEIARRVDQYIAHESEVAAENLRFLNQETRRVRGNLTAGSVAAAMVCLVIPWAVARKTIRPLRNLQRAAERIGNGDLETEVEVPPIREIGRLAATFNEMARDLRKSRHDLQTAEGRLQLAARDNNDVMWDLDLVTEEVWLGERLRSWLGVTAGQTANVSLFKEMLHPDDRERVEEGIAAALGSSEQFWSDEYRLRRASGGYLFIYDRAWIVRRADGTAVRVIGAAMDITARKEAEQAVADLTRQKELILDSVGDGVLGVDADAHVMSVNPAATRTLRCAAADLIGTDLREIIDASVMHERRRSWEETAIGRTLLRGTLEESDLEAFLRCDGSSFPVEYTSNAIFDEQKQVVGAVMTFRDITQRQEIERMKAQFVSTVSHELRTPLTSIRGALGLLRGGLLGNVSDKGQRMLEIAVSNTDRLVRLINDILDVERLDSGQIALDRREVDVATLMQQALDLMKPMADKAEVALRIVPFHGTIAVDHDRLMQTFTNLLSNAIKFSPTGTTVTLAAERVESAMQFSVSDRGRGIPGDKLESIFERFRQVDASDSRDKGGTGLGLSICRSIVQQHGGKIWVESTLGEGSTFSFTIPASNKKSWPRPAMETVDV